MLLDSDKVESGLFKAYELLFAGLKDTPIKYLEMGVYHGGSMEWAFNFFAEGSEIYGLDRQLPQLEESIGGVKLFQIDQEDSIGMVKFGKQFGDFDIIIDDASHQKWLTENTFKALYPFLKPGGFYLIEDWAAGYDAEWEGLHDLVLWLVNQFGGAVIRPDSKGTFAIIGAGHFKSILPIS